MLVIQMLQFILGKPGRELTIRYDKDNRRFQFILMEDLPQCTHTVTRTVSDRELTSDRGGDKLIADLGYGADSTLTLQQEQTRKGC